MTDIVYIVLSIIAGILFIPIILLFVWWIVLICKKIYEGMITTMIKTIRVHRLKFLHETRKHQDDITKLKKEAAEEISIRNEERSYLKDIIWGRIILWTDEHYIIVGFVATLLSACAFVLVMFMYEKCMAHCCFCCHKLQFITADERVVLAFVGILATFVVITNHAQSTERIKQLEKMLTKKEAELKNTIEKQETEYKNAVDEAIRDVKKTHLLQTYEFIEACNNPATYKLGKKIAEDLRKKQKLSYKIGVWKGKKCRTAKAIIQDHVVYFVSDESPFGLISSKEIVTINGVEYRQDYLNTIVTTLLQLRNESDK